MEEGQDNQDGYITEKLDQEQSHKVQFKERFYLLMNDFRNHTKKWTTMSKTMIFKVI